MIRIGTAGWAIASAFAPLFSGKGSHLQRYASVFNAVEINSSFYRPHRRSTYGRWSESVPPAFRFSVKVPKAITHERRLVEVDRALDAFVDSIEGLGERLGCVLVQLPPSLSIEPPIAQSFFAALRDRYAGPIAVEARHASWFGSVAVDLLEQHRCASVAADPPCVPARQEPVRSGSFEYWRLHGSPIVYRSSYDDAYLDALATDLAHASNSGRDAWCIFDNTMLGAATTNAFSLRSLLPS